MNSLRLVIKFTQEDFLRNSKTAGNTLAKDMKKAYVTVSFIKSLSSSFLYANLLCILYNNLLNKVFQI